jgi:uncharacterized protein (TIGR02231 family)
MEFLPQVHRMLKHLIMKFPAVILLFVAIQSQAQLVQHFTAPDIKDIRIFQNGAEVRRTLKTTVEAGITQISVEGLSAGIDKNSITVSGSGRYTLLAVGHQLNYLQPGKKTDARLSLEDTLEALTDEQVSMANQKSVITDEQELLKANRTVGGANTGLTVENLQKVADFFHSRMTALKIRMAELEKKEKENGKSITRIQQQLREMNAQYEKPSGAVLITVSAKERTPCTFDLSYYVSGAGWTPLYDIRSAGVSSPIALMLKAEVVQNTGEEWNRVKLVLSTGNPSLGGTPPVLNPWYLSFRAPQPVMLEELRSRKRAASQAQGFSANALDQEVPAALPVTVMNGLLRTDYDIAVPYSVPADGHPQIVDIFSQELPATYAGYAIPKSDNDAFLTARVTGWNDLHLLPGKTKISFEGAYVGESFLDPAVTNDTLLVSLGRDKQVVIKREQVKDYSSTRFIGSTVEKQVSFRLTVRSAHQKNIRLTLVDQLPVSSTGDITVKAMELSGAALDPATGRLTWELDVPPGTAMEKVLTFSVRYPKDKIVNGL